MLTADLARQLLAYDPQTERLVWLHRPASMFATAHACNSWNAKNAGNVAGETPYRDGYRCVGIMGKSYATHRVVWLLANGVWPSGDIDHINGVRHDNRLANLRDVTRSQNLRNAKLSDSNKSGVCGVYWHAGAHKWTAQITAGGKAIHLGLFSTIEAATAARKVKEAELGFHPNHGRKAA